MPQEPSKTENTPATYRELKSAFPKASAEFLTSQLEADATIEQARNAYQAQLEKAVEDARKETEAAKAQATAEAKVRAEAEAKAKADADAAGKQIGVPPVADEKAGAKTTDDDPIVAWNNLVAKHTSAGMSRDKAIKKVVHENPEAHKAYLDAWNEKHRIER